VRRADVVAGDVELLARLIRVGQPHGREEVGQRRSRRCADERRTRATRPEGR
jgi:hypothetical protein